MKNKNIIILGIVILGIVILFYVNLNNPPTILLAIEGILIISITSIARLFLPFLSMAKMMGAKTKTNDKSSSNSETESKKEEKKETKKETKNKNENFKNIDELTSVWMG